ncbi:MAG: hypothetical protein R3248_14390 [Candidatus Promineifilaceae bacterium]|nr:hypothetical protein [Candidatus Promineifilaceae bacterium]
MTRIDQLSHYTTLLQTRQKARRRDALIIGGIFFIALLAALALGLLEELQGRSLYVVLGITLVLGLSYLQVWVRLQVIRGNLELIDFMQRELGAGR